MSFPTLHTTRRAVLAGICAALLAVGGCSSEYGFSRSVFQGKVVDRPATEIESSVGKADAVQNLATGEVVWTFNKRTFDAENANANDAAVKITLKKDPKTGVLAYASIDFVSQ